MRCVSENIDRGEPFSVEVNGVSVPAYEGETVATVLFAQDVTAFRTTASGNPRGPFCMIGTCFECLVQVDGGEPESPAATGAHWVRACQTPVTENMRIFTDGTLPESPPSVAADSLTGASLNTELAIVGAGPAGVAAALEAARHGLDVTVVDEQPRPGGQIFRAPPSAFKVRDWMADRAYAEGLANIRKLPEQLGVRHLDSTQVLGIQNTGEGPESGGRFELQLFREGRLQTLAASVVLVATGCYDMPVMFPGNVVSGVMAAGGIQASIKSQQSLPGKRFLFAGTHPLQLIVANQVCKAGGEVAGVLFAQSPLAFARFLRHPGALWRQRHQVSLLLRTLLDLHRAGVPVSFRKTIKRAIGEDALEAVAVQRTDTWGSPLPGTQEELIHCNRLGLCFGFMASSELPRQLGAAVAWDSARGGWTVTCDDWMRSSIDGLFVAGEVAGLGGADVALTRGAVAGLAAAMDLRKIDAGAAGKLVKPLRRRLGSLEKFADSLAQGSLPGNELLSALADEASMLCKCREVTLGDFNQSLDANAFVATANSAKLLTGTGMGLCQGRYCQHHVTRLLQQRHGTTEQQVGPFTARFPAKPVLCNQLIQKSGSRTLPQ